MLSIWSAELSEMGTASSFTPRDALAWCAAWKTSAHDGLSPSSVDEKMKVSGSLLWPPPPMPPPKSMLRFLTLRTPAAHSDDERVCR